MKIRHVMTGTAAAVFLTAASAFSAYAGPAGEATAVSEQSAKVPETRTTADGIPADYAGNFRITAYCASETGSSMTCSGKHAKSSHTIAADLNVFPLGTRLLIGDTVYTVEDCGGAVKGNKLDIYFDTYKECINWGVRHKDVYRLQDPAAAESTGTSAAGPASDH